MNNQIFCPSNHLVLDNPTCSICGWQRPPNIPQGQFLWDFIYCDSGIGGPAREIFYRPGIMNGIAVFPLRSGELVAISQKDGSMLWQSEASPEIFPRQFYPEGNRLLAVLSDFRSINDDEERSAYLVYVDPVNGEMEKAWKGYGFTMTEPAFSESLILVRTSKAKLVALNRSNISRVVWETPLKSYKPISPVIADEMVLAWDGDVTQDQMILKAFSLNDGNPLWKTSIQDIDCPPIVVGEKFIYRSRKRLLSAVDLKNGDQLWQKDFSRIYSTPAGNAGKINLIMSDDPNINSPAHYSLMQLYANSGTAEWQSPIGIRAQEVLYQPDGTLLIGMGDPQIAICSPQDGSIMWKHSFGEEKINRVQTHLVVDNGVCWSGTYEGKITAIRVSETSETMPDLKECLEQEDFEGAAIGYALTGKLQKSAELYLNQLNQPQKALAIYEQINDLSGQACALERLGNDLSAAHIYEKDGQFKKAAELYEEADELRSALELYKQIKSKEDVERLLKLVPLKLSDVEELERDGKLVEAGDAAFALKEYRKAVDLYERSGQSNQEKTLKALVQLCENNPETWSLEKLSKLAGNLLLYEIQATAFEKMGKECDAAEAFLKAAEQVEEKDPTNNKQILLLYQKAGKYFELEGMIVKHQKCKSRIMFYQKTPWILVGGKTEKAFKELHFNTLFLFVKNVGYDRASDISIRVIGDNFKVDESSLPEPIKALAISAEKHIELSIMPNKEKVGEDVRFVLEWYWKDRDHVEYKDRTTVKVVVKSQSDSRTGGTPVTINADNVTYVDGEYVHHEFGGDNIESGGRKDTGDKVEINKEGHTRIFDSTLDEPQSNIRTRKCEQCGATNGHEKGFCDKCGSKLDA